MKNILKIGLSACCLLLALSSCKQEDTQVYSGSQSVNLLFASSVKGIEVSFLTLPLGTTEHSVDVYVNLQTKAADYDRTVKLALTDTTTAVIGTNFRFPLEVVIPAGAPGVIVPCVLIREGLDKIKGGVTLGLTAVVSKDFVGAGINKEIVIKFSDEFPTQWVPTSAWFNSFLGTCTAEKYKLIYDVMGIIDLKDWNDMNFANALKGYLNEYIKGWNKANPDKKYLDASGNELVF